MGTVLIGRGKVQLCPSRFPQVPLKYSHLTRFPREVTVLDLSLSNFSSDYCSLTNIILIIIDPVIHDYTCIGILRLFILDVLIDGQSSIQVQNHNQLIVLITQGPLSLKLVEYKNGPNGGATVCCRLHPCTCSENRSHSHCSS